MTPLWERTPPRFVFADRLVMTPDQFHLLPEAPADPEAIIAADLAKAMIQTDHGPRWHAVNREIARDGRPIALARPISVRVYQAEE